MARSYVLVLLAGVALLTADVQAGAGFPPNASVASSSAPLTVSSSTGRDGRTDGREARSVRGQSLSAVEFAGDMGSGDITPARDVGGECTTLPAVACLNRMHVQPD
jgi:hypothetical protein